METKISRRFFVYAGLVAALGTGVSYSRFVEPNFIRMTSHDVSIGRKAIRGSVAGRILHVADLHYGGTSLDFIEEAFALGLRTDPDVIFITGDLIDHSLTDPRPLRTFFENITSRAKVFASMGNHDGGEWARKAMRGHEDSHTVRELLSESGVRVLHNTSELVEIGDSTFQIVGLGDYWSGEFEPDEAFENVDTSYPTIVLSHNPDSKISLDAFKWDLMLSGHTHGGQIRVPFTGATPFAPVKDKRFVSGLNAWGNRLVHTTQGIATTANFRFNCRPEVTLLNVI